MKSNILTGVFQLFVGIGAFFGGLFLMIKPDGSILGLPVETLEGSIFNDYLIPGIILFSIIGIGHIIATWLSVSKKKWAPYFSFSMAIGLITWIIVQISIVGGLHFLQVAYFIFGLIELVLSFLMFQNYKSVVKEVSPVI